jgi:hypothetical protein
MRTIICLLAWLVPAAVFAGEPVIHGGVPVDALTPAGMQRLSIEAPTAAGRPVRLSFGASGTAEVVMEVLVAADAASARAALDDWKRTMQLAPPGEALGDAGYGGGTTHGFVRDNVFAMVRRVAGEADAAAIAAQVDAAIKNAPAGDPTLAAVAVQSFDDAQLGADPVPLAFASGLIAANVSVCGPAYARRTAAGWVLVRTAPGAVTVRVTGVDVFLRVTR